MKNKYLNILKSTRLISIAALSVCMLIPALSQADRPVGITGDIFSVTIKHQGKDVEIKRDQDPTATITPDYTLTSRACPPFCIQPATAAEGVDTVEELEVLDYLKKKDGGDDSIVVMDSRTPDWVAKGTIPGSVNVPWTELNPAKGATTESIVKLITTQFGVKLKEGVDAFDIDEALTEGTANEVLDYSGAKTLVFFCNGAWCGQSPTAIKTLLTYKYPADKMKWYRGGMQSWHVLGLTTVKGK